MNEHNLISSIELHKFKGFERIRINDFGQLNLIGGRNNIGKTALLEAVYLNSSPIAETVLELLTYRDFDSDEAHNNPEKAWSSLFFNYDTNNEINICSYDEDKQPSFSISLKSDTEIDEFREYLIQINNDDNYDDDANSSEEFLRSLSNQNAKRGVLKIVYQTPNSDTENSPTSFLIATSKQIMGGGANNDPVKDVFFIPSSRKVKNKTLAIEYGEVFLRGEGEQVLNMIKLVDPTIQRITSQSLGEPKLYLKRENEPWMPISAFGDAIRRVVNIVVHLLNKRTSVFLIDEIENGLHHSLQENFWGYLFDLAKELDVQLFATTHSLEMITAFQKISSEKQAEISSAYIKLSRHFESDRVIGSVTKFDILGYKLERNMEVRGE